MDQFIVCPLCYKQIGQEHKWFCRLGAKLLVTKLEIIKHYEQEIGKIMGTKVFICTEENPWHLREDDVDAGFHKDAEKITDESDPDFGVGGAYRCPHCQIVYQVPVGMRTE